MSQVELRVTGKLRSWAALRRLAGLALLGAGVIRRRVAKS